MSLPGAVDHGLAGHLASLIGVASRQDKLAGLREILRALAKALRADGCTLWEVAPGTGALKERRLFVLAEYFSGTQFPNWRYLPMRSHTGIAIQEHRTIAVSMRDVTAGADYAERSFLERHGIQTFCSTPIALRGGTDAAISIYRAQPDPFTDSERAQIEQFAGLIPFLYTSLVNQVGFELLRDIGKIMRGAGPLAGDLSDRHAKRQFQETLDVIVGLIGRTFNCLETSLFLEDPIDSPGFYDLKAKCWPWPRDPKLRYRKGEGATGYVLRGGGPVRIFDLGRYDEDRELIEREYPGLVWADPIDIKSAARAILGLTPEQDLPPLSFMCAPILDGGTVLGVIRCCVTKTGPHFFDDRQVRFLCLVGEQLGEWWGNRISLRRTEAENQRWRELVTGISRLNRFVHDELNRPEPSEQRIFDQTMEVAASINPAADILSVRLIDEASQELHYAAWRGSAWDRGSQQEVQARKDLRFPIRGKQANSAGAQAVRSEEVKFFTDPEEAPLRSLFPEVSSMIVAPIISGDKVYGVLDLRGIDSHTPPPYAIASAELLGRQLGLYHYLALKIRELNQTQRRLTEANETQHKIFDDFQHQLKTPILLAHRKAKELARQSFTFRDEDIYALRGLCRRAEQVARNLGLFVSLAKEEPVPVKPSVLLADELSKRLHETARDHSLLINPERRISFDVELQSLEVLRTITVYADPDLLDHALNNLLDNAGKYSYDRTRIAIRGGLTRKREAFYIAVINRGLKIQQNERGRLAERGYRGEQALWCVGEGSGIGLWIVSRIMEAHKGALDILLTDERGLNVIRLLFPILKTT